MSNSGLRLKLDLSDFHPPIDNPIQWLLVDPNLKTVGDIANQVKRTYLPDQVLSVTDIELFLDEGLVPADTSLRFFNSDERVKVKFKRKKIVKLEEISEVAVTDNPLDVAESKIEDSQSSSFKLLDRQLPDTQSSQEKSHPEPAAESKSGSLSIESLQTATSSEKFLALLKKEKKIGESSSSSSVTSISLSSPAAQSISSLLLVHQTEETELSMSFINQVQVELLQQMKRKFGRFGLDWMARTTIKDDKLYYECGTPDSFWIYAWTSALEEMNEYIQTLRLREYTPKEMRRLQVGSWLFARFEVDNMIYRASVEGISEVMGKHLVKVRFIDYGNTAEVGRLQLYQWESNFEIIPPQAVCCKLKNIFRISKTVLPDTEEHFAFSKIMRSINPLQVSIHEKLYDSSFHSRHFYTPQLVISVHDKDSESIFEKLKFSPVFRETIMDAQSVSVSYFSCDSINRDRLEILDYKPPSKLSKVPEPIHLADCDNVVVDAPRSPVHPLLTNRAVEKVTWWLEREEGRDSKTLDNVDKEDTSLMGIQTDGATALDDNENEVESKAAVENQSQPKKSHLDCDSERKELVNRLRSAKAASSLSSCSGQTKSKSKPEESQAVADTRAVLSKAIVTKGNVSYSKPKAKVKEVAKEMKSCHLSPKEAKKVKKGNFRRGPNKSFPDDSKLVFTHQHESSFPGSDIRYKEINQGRDGQRKHPPVTVSSQKIELNSEGGFDFMVCHKESMDKFYVHPIQASTCQFDQMKESTLSICQDPESSIAATEDIKEGTLWLWREQNERVSINRIYQNSLTVDVFLIDWGSSVANVSMSSLLVIAVDWIRDLPGLAVECFLSPSSAVSRSSPASVEKAKEYFDSYLQSDTIYNACVMITEPSRYGIAIFQEDSTVNEHIMELLEPGDNDILDWDPREEDYHDLANNYCADDEDVQQAVDGYKSKEKICPFFANYNGKCYKGNYCEDIHANPRHGAVTLDQEEAVVSTFEDGGLPSYNEEILVTVESVNSPSSLYISLPYGNKHVSKLTESERRMKLEDVWSIMEEEMQRKYKNNRKYFLDSLPTPGMMIAAKCPSTSRWKRAVVLNDTAEDGLAEVFLVDSGLNFNVVLDNIRHIDKSFTILPHKVIEACIADIEPRDEQGWPEDSAGKMFSLCSSSDYIKATPVASIGEKLVLKMTACCSSNAMGPEQEMDIGMRLCQDNFAREELKGASKQTNITPG